jgi:predicted nucleotidyltransferase
MSHAKRLLKNKVIKNIEPWIIENIQYETIMGSSAYGVSNNDSDLDVYGFTIPPKGIVFPHTQGYIKGFGKQPPNFKVWQQHHLKDNGKEYDFAVYNIVDYFSLCMDNNPNMIDSLFTRDQSVSHSTKIGKMVKDNRHLFLHKGAWHRFKGYSYSQMKKISNRNATGKRAELIEQFGYDVKFAYHCVRLLNECEQILMTGDIDLMQNNDQLKEIRAGGWSFNQLQEYFDQKERNLEELYVKSDLQKYPDEDRIKALLIDCLEEHYGTISNDELQMTNKLESAMQDIKQIVSRF